MNHEFQVSVYGITQLELIKKATAAADKFYGPGNWREDTPASVVRSSYQYYATYYFTDVPEVYGCGITNTFNDRGRISA